MGRWSGNGPFEGDYRFHFSLFFHHVDLKMFPPSSVLHGDVGVLTTKGGKAGFGLGHSLVGEHDLTHPSCDMFLDET